jgi:hypothetical protein
MAWRREVAYVWQVVSMCTVQLQDWRHSWEERQ